MCVWFIDMQILYVTIGEGSFLITWVVMGLGQGPRPALNEILHKLEDDTCQLISCGFSSSESPGLQGKWVLASRFDLFLFLQGQKQMASYHREGQFRPNIHHNLPNYTSDPWSNIIKPAEEVGETLFSLPPEISKGKKTSQVHRCRFCKANWSLQEEHSHLPPR